MIKCHKCGYEGKGLGEFEWSNKDVVWKCPKCGKPLTGESFHDKTKTDEDIVEPTN